jgi:hypothetical protein
MMNSRFYLFLFLICLFLFMTGGCYDCEDSNVIEVFETKKLDRGKQKGTFKFVYEVHFSKHFKTSFPVAIQIREEFFIGDVLYSKRVEKFKSTTISYDLPPGKYFIVVSPIKQKHRDEYWDDGAGPFEIDESGILKYNTFEIYPEKKIHVNAPDGTITIPDDQSALKLVWAPVTNAVRYEMRWHIMSAKNPKISKRFSNYGIKVNHFEFNFDIHAHYFKEDEYDITWMLSACNRQGLSIGYQHGIFSIKIDK